MVFSYARSSTFCTIDSMIESLDDSVGLSFKLM